MFEIFPIRVLSDNYVWTLVEGDQAIIVDPGEAKPVLETLNELKLKLKGIIITHHHFDHTAGIQEVKDNFHCHVYGPGGGHIQGIDSPLKDNEEFVLLGKKFIALSTPGHTLDQLAYYSDEACSKPILFCGDTLFSAGCGRIFEGTYQQMFNSLNKIKSLPGETKIYCGHEYTKNNLGFCLKYNPNNNYLRDKEKLIDAKIRTGKPTIPSTIKDEIQTNIFFRYDDLDVKDALNLKNASDLEIFTKLRDLKDNF